ncbi:hypothetical protein PC129_g1223 [Phytophthora cactorum]|uniref:Beta-adaptin appendage C-terminal subdomain domain-containing protein n=1 Tax=Phytophthora cactorum TaxID=29920 RepID=A0A329SFY7_9STRA|nr:hypothetical protein PC112_g2254 [Phytophthora cactorum]KAG2844716.1 hypothetical protein PC111_g1889 [Phytophthora cactorum]KAG2866987.1 hypothetical protein PC113_g2381 [Phytophthora cactorum]KAG2932176.1 hypothetical protein PC114_g1913 [Phytophthora cactorum]KAG2941892.1 hypothetical protein PC115_g1697 [Phytophthora cactorum]
MGDLWRRRRRMALSLCVLLVVHLYYVSSASVSEITASLRSLSPKINDDAAPPVFCLEVGVEIAFPSRDVEDAMGSETQASAGTGCLRSSPMNAVMDHLKVSLRTFSLHAVDCVLEPMDVESSTIALLGITSLCSRSNMDVEEDMDTWGREAKRQVDRLFETEKRISLDQTTGMVRHVSTSPAYELPNSGSGLPQFVLGETLIWSDDEGETKEATKDQTFFTHVQLHVKNDGKTSLHLYRLTLVEKGQGRTVQDKTVGFVLPLVAPAVVPPGMSEVVSFKAITGTAVDSTKSYLLYISHSGFRSHVFEGILDGKTFLSREEAVQPQGEDGLFDRFSLDSVSGQSLFPSFPYATWQVGSMAIAVAVGLAVTLYIRRKRLSARLMGHAVKRCLRSPSKKGEPGGRTSAKPVSNRVASSRAAISKRGEDHIEMESLIKKPNVSEASNSDSSASIKLPTPPRSRMPAITMKWKAPPPPPQTTASVTKKTLLAIPKALETQKLLLDLDHKARLHPKRFESMWDEYVERFQSELPNAKRPDSDTLLKKMKTHGISCMASGTVNGVEKYVFYAKQRDRSSFFLATVDVTVATATTVLTVRASSDATEELVTQLVHLLKATIAQSVGS